MALAAALAQARLVLVLLLVTGITGLGRRLQRIYVASTLVTIGACC